MPIRIIPILCFFIHILPHVTGSQIILKFQSNSCHSSSDIYSILEKFYSEYNFLWYISSVFQLCHDFIHVSFTLILYRWYFIYLNLNVSTHCEYLSVFKGLTCRYDWPICFHNFCIRRNMFSFWSCFKSYCYGCNSFLSRENIYFLLYSLMDFYRP